MSGLQQFTFHALSHTFTTRTLKVGISIKAVRKLLGHASVEITMDTYSHELPEFRREVVSRFRRVL